MPAPHVPRHHVVHQKTRAQRFAGRVAIVLLVGIAAYSIAVWLKSSAPAARIVREVKMAPGSNHARLADLERRVTAIEVAME